MFNATFCAPAEHSELNLHRVYGFTRNAADPFTVRLHTSDRSSEKTHQTDPIRQYLETRPSLVYHLYRNIQYWILQPFTRNRIHVIMRQKSQSKPLTNLKTNNRTEKNIMKSERGTLHLKRQKSHLCQTRFC